MPAGPIPSLSFADTGHAISGAGGFDEEFNVNFAPVFGDQSPPPIVPPVLIYAGIAAIAGLAIWKGFR